MSTTIREALACSKWSRGQDFMGKRLALLAIRLLVSMNLRMPPSFSSLQRCQIRWPVHADVASGPRLVTQPVFRLGSGAFETVVAVLLLIPRQPDWEPD